MCLPGAQADLLLAYFYFQEGDVSEGLRKRGLKGGLFA
jgi:hypothetical protein